MGDGKQARRSGIIFPPTECNKIPRMSSPSESSVCVGEGGDTFRTSLVLNEYHTYKTVQALTM